jgi:hypothetical protein
MSLLQYRDVRNHIKQQECWDQRTRDIVIPSGVVANCLCRTVLLPSDFRPRSQLIAWGRVGRFIDLNEASVAHGSRVFAAFVTDFPAAFRKSWETIRDLVGFAA